MRNVSLTANSARRVRRRLRRGWWCLMVYRLIVGNQGIEPTDRLRHQDRGGVVAPLQRLDHDTHAHPHTPSQNFGGAQLWYIQQDIHQR